MLHRGDLKYLWVKAVQKLPILRLLNLILYVSLDYKILVV